MVLWTTTSRRLWPIVQKDGGASGFVGFSYPVRKADFFLRDIVLSRFIG